MNIFAKTFVAVVALAPAALSAGSKDGALVYVRAVDVSGESVECRVTSGGRLLGTTPVFISSLETNAVHRLSLSANGYRDETFDIAAKDRTPVFHIAKMTLDSGLVKVDSVPQGAAILVNGTVRGTTPATIKRVPKGIVTIAVELEGYSPEKREMKISAGDELSVSFDLQPMPSPLEIVSVPSGARIYVDGEFRGVSPVRLPDMRPGSHELRADLPDHATETRTIDLAAGKPRTEEFRMSSTLGTINLLTTPAGAEVFLDGRKVGVTAAQQGSAVSLPSLPFPLAGVSNEKEHVVTVRKSGFREIRRIVKRGQLSPGESKTMRVVLEELFIPDYLIIDTNGREIKGVLRSETPGGVTIATKPGVEETIPAKRIKYREKLITAPGAAPAK